MTSRTWVILGATSIIAEHFAHIAAKAGHHLRLIGRDKDQLGLIAKDIELRYKVPCEYLIMDMTQPADELMRVLESDKQELDLFIAHSEIINNDHLSSQKITQLIQVNILATSLLIHAYLETYQSSHNLLFLSSVAACKGRAKNSLYGGSKAAIEVYLQGLQQKAHSNQHISIARLGVIDTHQTYGMPGIFYAAPPEACAKACWNAVTRHKRNIYFPKFWLIIMTVIKGLPFFIYKKMSKI